MFNKCGNLISKMGFFFEILIMNFFLISFLLYLFTEHWPHLLLNKKVNSVVIQMSTITLLK